MVSVVSVEILGSILRILNISRRRLYLSSETESDMRASWEGVCGKSKLYLNQRYRLPFIICNFEFSHLLWITLVTCTPVALVEVTSLTSIFLVH